MNNLLQVTEPQSLMEAANVTNIYALRVLRTQYQLGKLYEHLLKVYKYYKRVEDALGENCHDRRAYQKLVAYAKLCDAQGMLIKQILK